MDFAFDERTEQLRTRLLTFMTDHVQPAEPVYAQQAATLADPFDTPPVMAALRSTARELGLWSLCVPDPERGTGLTNLQYAPLAEIAGHSAIAPDALNGSVPDAGNMAMLAQFGTDEQKTRWLRPLLDGEIRSAFCMTEPDVASSDATNIATRITRDGDHYILNGRKSWVTGALSPQCTLLLVLGNTDPTGQRHRQHSVVLMPIDTPGVQVLRDRTIFGFTETPLGHPEITFTNARIPAANILGEPGHGFAVAQARLASERIQHCMEFIGMADRALELLCLRVLGRTAWGKPLAEQGVIQDWIAESRVRIEQARLLALKAAWLMDTHGSKAAHNAIQAIKIVTPTMAEWVIDKAIQAHGAAGVGQDFPLAWFWAKARAFRIADGPDEIHRMSLARNELKLHTTNGERGTAPTAGRQQSVSDRRTTIHHPPPGSTETALHPGPTNQ